MEIPLNSRPELPTSFRCASGLGSIHRFARIDDSDWMKTSQIGGDATASVILINTDNDGKMAEQDGKEFCLTREREGPLLDWVVHKPMGSSPSPLSLTVLLPISPTSSCSISLLPSHLFESCAKLTYSGYSLLFITYGR